MAADICVPVNSRWVLYIALISDKLVVQFKNGDCALYPGSNVALFNRMRNARSKGRFVNQFLRDLPYRKIAPPCPLADATILKDGCEVPTVLTASQVSSCVASTTITYNAGTDRWEGVLTQSSGTSNISFGFYTGPGPLAFLGNQWYLTISGGSCGASVTANNICLGACSPMDKTSVAYFTPCCGGSDSPTMHITE